MRLIIAVLLAFCAPAAHADSDKWRALSGDEITQALTGLMIQYPSAKQDFRASGQTRYNAGRDSWGSWTVRGSQYCSLWPPQGLWTCYDLQQLGNRLRFVGAAGDVIEGELMGAIDQ